MATIFMIFPKLYQPEKSQPKQRRHFSFSRPGPWAYFSNVPNAAAPIAPTLMDAIGGHQTDGRIALIQNDPQPRAGA